ncbi:MAG TPA: OmpH family outer membrane protein [Thermoanaerobaculaceae bacterium]|nr:OmpH family outer membrane protein [Thermoanaerobaculaceae bacterium]
MSRYTLGGALLAGVSLAAVAFGQQQAPPPAPAQQQAQPVAPATGPSKIAFVYVQRALAASEEGKARLKDLDTWARPRQDELAKLDKEINDLKGELIAKQGVASDDAIADLNKRIVAKQREFEDKQRTGKRDFESRQQALLKELGGKLQDLINKYADENHYTAVFIFNPDQLAYLSRSADITDVVIKLYNERYPVAAPTAPAPAK